MENTELKNELIEMFGNQKVQEVIAVVEMSDPDCAYSTFQDMEDEDACEIIEALYFEQD